MDAFGSDLSSLGQAAKKYIVPRGHTNAGFSTLALERVAGNPLNESPERVFELECGELLQPEKAFCRDVAVKIYLRETLVCQVASPIRFNNVLL